jgi:iron(III) transport system permease protein
MAYIALYMAQALLSTEAAAALVGHELDDAAAVSGARGLRRFVRISLPLMAPSLAVGWALVFVRIVEDLTASAILSGTSNSVVGFRMLEVYSNGSYGAVGALALVVTAVVLVVLVPVFTLGRPEWLRSSGQ